MRFEQNEVVEGIGRCVLKLPLDFRREFWNEIGSDAEPIGETDMDENGDEYKILQETNLPSLNCTACWKHLVSYSLRVSDMLEEMAN